MTLRLIRPWRLAPERDLQPKRRLPDDKRQRRLLAEEVERFRKAVPQKEDPLEARARALRGIDIAGREDADTPPDGLSFRENIEARRQSAAEIAKLQSQFRESFELQPGPGLLGAIANAAQPIVEGLKFERKQTQRLTRPAFRAIGETLTENVLGVPGAPILRRAGVDVPEAPFKGKVGEAFADVGGEVALASNLIPIPIIDPLVARAIVLPLKLARGGAKVAPKAAQAILRRIRGLADDASVEPAVRELARHDSEALRAAIEGRAERPVAGAAGDVPRAAGEGVPEVPDDFEIVQGVLDPKDIAAGQRLGVRDIVGAQLERDVARLENQRRTALAREAGRDPLAGTANPPSVGGRDLPGAGLERLEPLPLERALSRDFPTRIRETAPARPPSAGGRDLPGEALTRRERLSESDLAKDLGRDYPRRPRFQSSTPLRRGEEDTIGDALERLSGQPDRVIPISVTHRGVALEDLTRQVDETKQVLDSARERLTIVRRNVRDGIVPEVQMADAAEDLNASRIAWRQSQTALRDADIRVAFDDIATRARAAGADEDFVNILRAGYEDSLRLIPNDEPLLTASALRQRIARTVAAVEGTPPGTVGAIAQQRHIVETAIRRETEEQLALIANTLDRALYRELDNIVYTGSKGQGADWWKAMSSDEQLSFIEMNGIKDRVIVQHPDWWSGMSPELRQALKQAQSFQAGKLRIAETMGYPIKAIERPYLEQLWDVPRSVLEAPLPGFQGKVSIAKERAFGDYIEGVHAGLTPKEMTVGELVEHSSSLMDEAIGDAFERRLVLERFGVLGTRPTASGYRQFNTPLYAGHSAPSPIVNFVDQLHSPIMFSALRRSGPLHNVAAAVKGTVFGIMDFGVFGTHLIDAMALGGPRIVAAQINRGLRTMQLPHAQIWLDDNLDAVVRHGLDGVNQGMGPSAVQIKGGTIFKYIPFVGEEVDRPISAAVDSLARIQFGGMLRPIRNLLHEGNLVALHLTGSDITDPAVRRASADAANAIGGASRGAMTPGRRQVETIAFTSFQMGRSEMARYGLIAKAAFSPTATKEERILGAMSLASFGAVVYGLGSAINMWMGNGPVEFDPRRGDWAAIEVKGQKVPLIGRRALLRAIAKSYDVLAEEDPTEVARIWTQYAVAKLNPLTAPVQSALGIGFESDARGFQVGTLSAEARLLNMAPLPPLAEAVLTDPRSRTPTALGFEATGFNVFPVSEFTLWERARETVFQERKAAGDQPYANFASYEELRQADRPAAEQIDEDPRVQQALQNFDESRRRETPESRFFDETDVVRDEFRQEQERDDDLLGRWFLTGGEEGMPPTNWQDGERERAKTSFDQREGIRRAFGIEFEDEEGKAPRQSVNAAVERYFAVDIEVFTDQQTQEVDWGAYFDARDRALSGLSTGDRGRVMDFINRSETGIQGEFRKLRDELDEYYDIPSEDREGRLRWRRRNPRGDAILFVTGSTTSLRSSAARREATALARRIFGSQAEIPRGERRQPIQVPTGRTSGGTTGGGIRQPVLIR